MTVSVHGPLSASPKDCRPRRYKGSSVGGLSLPKRPDEKSGVSIRTPLLAAAVLCILCCRAYASAPPGPNGGTDEVVQVLLALVVILVAAKLGGEVFVRLGQPAVLGELVLGVAVGNAYLLGFHGFDFIVHFGENGQRVVNEYVDVLSEIGVVLLLFQVGLESDLDKMMKVGPSSLAVASLGVAAPFFLGWGTSALFLPGAATLVHVFIGATLCATSVGITARVLHDLGRVQTPEARIILGAAVIDDVQGLIILAVVSGIITTAAAGEGSVSSLAIFTIVLKATAFLVGALVVGRWIAPKVFRFASRLRASDLLLATALVICFGFAYIAELLGLNKIVGAFAAGLILEEVHWRTFTERGEHSMEELVRPIAGFLVPIFFVTMGARVELATFAKVSVLGFAAVLTLAAILGKQICGLGVLQKGLDRISVGIGMIPRGEVGLIFAAIGSTLILDGGPVIAKGTFSAVVIMVVVTTMIAPPALKLSLARSARIRRAQGHDDHEAEPA